MAFHIFNIQTNKYSMKNANVYIFTTYKNHLFIPYYQNRRYTLFTFIYLFIYLIDFLFLFIFAILQLFHKSTKSMAGFLISFHLPIINYKISILLYKTAYLSFYQWKFLLFVIQCWSFLIRQIEY